ncbi:hypothetical protein STRZYGA_00380 [Brevundimonas phage vB_BpoS-Strzyga]|nr:hypothetical protein STRZYGA_00380 [Brevundimonas phage vB_BpoS-Strzyga]
MWGRKPAPMGASFKEPKPQRLTKAHIAAAPILDECERQIARFIERARERQSSGDPVQASYWASQARRVINNRDRIEAALS